jgi:lysozyme family protein
MKNLLVHEGGKVDNPKDPGGRTNQGVTQKIYDAYRLGRKREKRDVYEMLASERDEIYRTRFWHVIGGDVLPVGLDYAVFDGAVNSGPVQAAKWLQRALGDRYMGQIDGHVGQGTLTAVATVGDVDALIDKMLDSRMAFLRSLKTFAVFGKGWTRRVAEVRCAAKDWATGGNDKVAELGASAAEKAPISAAKAPPRKMIALADLATGGGVGGTGLMEGISSQLDSAKMQFGAFQQIQFVEKMLFWMTIAGVILAAGGLAAGLWYRYQRRVQTEALDLDTTQMWNQPPAGVEQS